MVEKWAIVIEKEKEAFGSWSYHNRHTPEAVSRRGKFQPSSLEMEGKSALDQYLLLKKAARLAHREELGLDEEPEIAWKMKESKTNGVKEWSAWSPIPSTPATSAKSAKSTTTHTGDAMDLDIRVVADPEETSGSTVELTVRERPEGTEPKGSSDNGSTECQKVAGPHKMALPDEAERLEEMLEPSKPGKRRRPVVESGETTPEKESSMGPDQCERQTPTPAPPSNLTVPDRAVKRQRSRTIIEAGETVTSDPPQKAKPAAVVAMQEKRERKKEVRERRRVAMAAARQRRASMNRDAASQAAKQKVSSVEETLP